MQGKKKGCQSSKAGWCLGVDATGWQVSGYQGVGADASGQMSRCRGVGHRKGWRDILISGVSWCQLTL